MLEADGALAWPRVWECLQAKPKFALSVFDTPIGDVSLVKYIVPSLSDHQLKDLFFWLRNQFGVPPQFSSIDSRPEWIAQHVVLAALGRRGRDGSIAALEEIQRQAPVGGEPDQIQALWDVRKAVWDAKRLMLESSWEPLDPSTVKRMVADKRQLLVRDEQELMNAVCCALGELQAAIRDERGPVMRLWNEPTFTPKPEESLSREIADELEAILQSRGVRATLETKIRESQFVDIYVSAVTSSSSNQNVSLIVEVKGCWHRDLRKAQETQLATRYLWDNLSSVGIYLVVWFVCDKWADSDPRKTETPFKTISELSTYLKDQAKCIKKAHGLSIRPFVLDATIEGGKKKAKRVKRS